MQTRKLGKSNLEVSAIGLGCMGMSFGYGPAGDRQEMIAVVAEASLKRINESTKFDSSDFRNIVPRFTPEARKANQAFVDFIRSVAERKKATPARIALAWLLAQRLWIVPIPGTTKLHRLDENVGAVEVELTSDDLHDIDRAAAKITVQGARHPENLERLTGR